MESSPSPLQAAFTNTFYSVLQQNLTCNTICPQEHLCKDSYWATNDFKPTGVHNLLFDYLHFHRIESNRFLPPHRLCIQKTFNKSKAYEKRFRTTYTALWLLHGLTKLSLHSQMSYNKKKWCNFSTKLLNNSRIPGFQDNGAFYVAFAHCWVYNCNCGECVVWNLCLLCIAVTSKGSEVLPSRKPLLSS